MLKVDMQIKYVRQSDSYNDYSSSKNNNMCVGRQVRILAISS